MHQGKTRESGLLGCGCGCPFRAATGRKRHHDSSSIANSSGSLPVAAQFFVPRGFPHLCRAPLGCVMLDVMHNDDILIQGRSLWWACFEWPDRAPGPSNVEIADYHLEDL
jgi:hypothetical protein